MAGISKVEAVRRALDDLGKDAKPAEIQPYVKQKFGLDMTPAHITTCKGTILKQAGKGKPKPPVAAKPPAPTVSAKAGVGGVSLQDIGTVKELMSRVGADSLRTLIDLLCK